MITTGYKPLKSKVLIIENGLDRLDTALGRSAQAVVMSSRCGMWL